MPPKKTIVAPLPQHWLDAVIPLLEGQEVGTILWTSRAEREMTAAGIGFRHEVYELCLRVLGAIGMLGEEIHGMVDESDNTACETRAFFSVPIPFNSRLPFKPRSPSTRAASALSSSACTPTNPESCSRQSGLS